MRSIALVLFLLPGCALAHEIGRDANVDVGPGSPEVLRPCPGGAGSMSGPGRDCGWNSNAMLPCTPGSTVRIGCSAECGLGSCSGDSMIRVCDGAPCTSARALAMIDDGGCGGGRGGVCSFIDGVTCPPSGQLFVMTGPFTAGSPYSCNIASR